MLLPYVYLTAPRHRVAFDRIGLNLDVPPTVVTAATAADLLVGIRAYVKEHHRGQLGVCLEYSMTEGQLFTGPENAILGSFTVWPDLPRRN